MFLKYEIYHLKTTQHIEGKIGVKHCSAALSIQTNAILFHKKEENNYRALNKKIAKMYQINSKLIAMFSKFSYR